MNEFETQSKDTKLAALLQRELALKAVIAAERERERQRNARERKRLIAILGAAALDQAERNPGFKLMFQQTLKASDLEFRDREFLSKLGW